MLEGNGKLISIQPALARKMSRHGGAVRILSYELLGFKNLLSWTFGQRLTPRNEIDGYLFHGFKG